MKPPPGRPSSAVSTTRATPTARTAREGRPERCSLEVMKRAIVPLLEPNKTYTLKARYDVRKRLDTAGRPTDG